MDQFDFKEDEEPKKEKRVRRSRSGSGGDISGIIWLLGSLYFLCMAVFLMAYFGMVFINPQASYNIFPPSTKVVVVIPPTLAPSATVPPTATDAAPTEVFFPTLTPTTAVPGATEVVSTLPPPTEAVFATSTEGSGNSSPFFAMQSGNPTYLAHPDGCGGLYVGGNVTDKDGAPLVFMLIRVSGLLAGNSLGIQDAASGTAPQYSESGYEIRLADAPIDSASTVFLQLIDLTTEIAVSDLILLNTFNDCSRNLIMVNFVQTQ